MPRKPASHTAKRARTREPDVTREKLLGAAFEEIYRHGFQAASLDAILAGAGVTKGALYHHFPNKSALGYAVVDEVIAPIVLTDWLNGFAAPGADPIDALHDALRNKFATIARAGHVPFGCPLNNLAQEMSPVEEAFRAKVNAVFDSWRLGFTRALERGQADGTVRRDIDAAKTAAFIIAAAEGSFGIAKSANSPELLGASLDVLHDFVESLRPAAREGSGTGAPSESRDAA
jgi:AcrR family transcriptional regulator